MKLLIDTHILIWSDLEPRLIAAPVRRALERQSNELWLSPVSTWEAILLADRGQVRFSSTFEQWISAMTAALSLMEAPLTHEVVLAAREIKVPHNDPADRLIAATARHYGLTLVTSDERLLRGSGFSSMKN